MASHRSDIDALNAIAVAVGATGGHRYNIDALNAWAAVDGDGGHKYEIDALNEIAVSAGAAGGHRYNVNALNAISLILEGSGGHRGDLAALNEIIDLPALSGGGGGGEPSVDVGGTFTPPTWNFVEPSPDIGGEGVTAAAFAVAPTGMWLVGDLDNSIDDFTGVTTITLTNITALIGSIALSDQTASLPLTSLVASSLKYASAINMDAPSLVDLDLSALETAGLLLLNHIAVSLLTLPDLTSSGTLFISNSATLTSVEMEGLTTISGSLNVSGNTLMSSFSAPALASVSEALTFSNNGLTSLALSTLTTVGETIDIDTNNSMVTLTLDALVSTGLHLNIIQNAALLNASMASLLAVGDTFGATENHAQTTISCSSLLSVGGSSLDFSACSYSQGVVDDMLVLFAALDGTAGTTSLDNAAIRFDAGTSAAPSATGLTAKATLEGRGNTVTVNS